MTTDEIFKNARWISTSDNRPGKPIGTDTPTLRARRSFNLSRKPGRATAYICGLGAFVLYINGKRVGDDLLSPAFTNYAETVLYCEYDVTELLTEGENLIAAEVAAGFYNQSTYDGWSFSHAVWRDFEKLLCSLYVDGEEKLVSDRSWRVTRLGPRISSQIRLGEKYDARLEDEWLEHSFDDSSWQEASLTRIPFGKLKKQELPPIKICEKIQYLQSIVCKNGKIYDFGRNISGNVTVKAKGKTGDTLTIRYGERLTEGELDNYINQYGIKNAEINGLQFGDRYTFSNNGVAEWHSEFVYYGFRYVYIEGAEEVLGAEANFIHTDLREKGFFSSSDERYNWLVSAGVTAFLSNFHGFSEDCPHREKNGWTGDAAISASHAVFRYDMKEAYKKWLSDITDCQAKSGQLPAIAPTSIYGYTWGAGPAWDHALFCIPDAYYRETGDDSLFDGIIDAGISYFDYAQKFEDEHGLVKFGLSDWCSPLEIGEEEMGDVLEGFPTEGRKRMTVATNTFSDSCYYYTNLRIFADALERRGDGRAEEYLLRSVRVLLAIRRAFIHDGTADNGTQSALAIALYHGILTEDETAAIAARLADKVKAAGYKMQCGILGTKAIFNVLAEHGYIDLCGKMLELEDYPSYGFWRRCGLQTLPELWEIADGSRNHHMYSDIVHWVYRHIGGLQNKGIAYDRALIAPFIFSDNCSAECGTETARGRISVAWSFACGVFSAKIEIPEGTEAALSVFGRREELHVGINNIRIETETRK